MSVDTNTGNKSFWPVKAPLKEKIVVLYDTLLNVCSNLFDGLEYFINFFFFVFSKYNDFS